MDQEISDFTIPVSNIYILDTAGIPLFVRYYYGDTKKADSVLFAGFLSAIEIFTRTSLESKLTDIGLEDFRFFFDRSVDRFMTVVATPNTNRSFNMDPLQVEILKHLLSKVNLAIDILAKTAKSHGFELNILIEDFGNMMDSIVLESTLEFANEKSILQQNYMKKFESGKEMDTSEFKEINRIIEKVKKFLN